MAVPLPTGRPVPSGRMAISHALMSASEIGLPSPGVSAIAAGALQASAITSRSESLRVDMFDLPLAVDAPAGGAVVVLVREGERATQRGLGLAAGGHELGTGRLHVAALVPGAALQDH